MQIKVVTALKQSSRILQNYKRSNPMMDLVMVALAFAFFGISIAYVYACEQL
jgi:hypothetical protein